MRFSPFRFLLLAAIALGTVSALPGQAVSPDSLAALRARGKTLFEGKGLCSNCHGKEGEGILGPTTMLTGSKGWLHTKGSQAEIIALIKSGVPDSLAKGTASMPPKGGSRLTDAEVEWVAMYVIELHSKPAPPKRPH